MGALLQQLDSVSLLVRHLEEVLCVKASHRWRLIYISLHYAIVLVYHFLFETALRLLARGFFS